MSTVKHEMRRKSLCARRRIALTDNGSPWRRKVSLAVAVGLGLLITSFNQIHAAEKLMDALVPYAKHRYARTIELLTPLADRGDAVAQLKLGIIWSRGHGVPRDNFAAFQWFARAAKRGQSDAQFELGVMYRDGLGTPADGKVAMRWFQRAAENGTPQAFNAIGELFLGRRDYAGALIWFVRGAELNNATAMYNIGMRYALGQGVVKDEIEAYKWFDLAGDAGVGRERDNAKRARIVLSERLTPLHVWTAKVGAEDWLRAHRCFSEMTSGEIGMACTRFR